MEKILEKIRENGKSLLTLPFARFDGMTGAESLRCVAYEAKQETRYLYEHNWTKYAYEKNGKLIPKHFDYLRLINGRAKNSPQLIVEVKGAYIRLTNENGVWEQGEEPEGETFLPEIVYILGNVIKEVNM